MTLLKVVLRHYRLSFIAVMVLSLLSAVLGIGVIAFINRRLIDAQGQTIATLWPFLGLIALLLVISLAAQLSLTLLGHRFVYNLRGRLVKRLLDTDIERIEALGSAPLLAALSSDIRNITVAFVRLPELIQGVVLSLAATVYLVMLSVPLFLVTAAWLIVTLAVGSRMVRSVYHHLGHIRDAEDQLYGDFQAIIDGRRELALNRDRAQQLYEEDFTRHARDYRHHIIRSDTSHLSAGNWTNIMMLGAIGVVFLLANAFGWASTAVAATFALTLLFIRAPLIQAVGALPTLLSGEVAFRRLQALELAPWHPDFQPAEQLPDDWQQLTLEGVRYTYAPRGEDEPFTVGPLALTLKRGEQVFVIGGNGSGKSTFGRLLSGLYAPHEGMLKLDGQSITDVLRPAWRERFAAVLTDFHLFDRLLGPDGEEADPVLVDAWLDRLGMREKVSLTAGRLNDTRLSQGQRKRLALLLAVAEQRDILLLDEWAADQDPVFRRAFYLELLPELRRLGITVIAITHDERYFAQADRLLLMQNGQLRELEGDDYHRASHDALQVASEPAQSPHEPGSPDQ
ncbi:multidrug ABC transporter permease/ATP-binding protein [Kushneria phosphatilytica]|uniref:Multidrug ABC transporter permease/ATP-binding protein n=1 Tax=Kushneria phosphatilytica TaxID=657387 RepID=A0A1S1NYM6_9GAMM|nr:multidrug ABC transporter permease/ATP-binding protein [Kushneria phosphatilytica]OHV12781.1 multidrug ABC transporter permease/ATP-binding protein [Kushneria phosphatilytica]QEL10630.1 multidrug ABC transporter permease/ATP-binding protein [Kushneria phosphatilytica]